MAEHLRKNGVPVWRDIGPTPAPKCVDGIDQAKFDVIIVGGGPVGLTLAIDLGRRGKSVLVLNKRDFIAAGSKAICFSKRTLDIWNRLGVGKAMIDKGVVWNIGKVFWGARADPIYTFDMLPVKSQQMPAFINLQQYYAEAILIDAIGNLPNVVLRWGHEVIGLEQREDAVTLEIKAGEEVYKAASPWIAACDGHTSAVRQLMDLDFEGRIFEDNFLIADIRLKQERPPERWFWFDPPFNPGQSALLHKQPDDVWRLDFQLGWNIDRDACIKPENVEPLVRGMLGSDVQFDPEWYSVYTFQCRRMARFLHGRVIFAGDSAHLVSPFGARGCNGGVADADNLAWKLSLVIDGDAPVSLLETYNDEAIWAADENILNSTRSTDFLTPKSKVSRIFRDAVLELAQDHAFARPFVNSGRLSTAVPHLVSRLNTPDADADWNAGPPPGSVAVDAPLERGWLLERVGHEGFSLICGDASVPHVPGAARIELGHSPDTDALLRSRFDLAPGNAYLLRPDQYVVARWRKPDAAAIESALRRSMGH